MKKLSLLVMITSIMVSLGCASDDAPSVVADTESPAAPLNLIASNITGTSALLSWDAATDNVAVTSYQIYQGATLVETNLTATSFSPLGLTEGSGYSYYIIALDAAGNESDGSNTVTFTTQEASLVFETTLSEMGVFSGTLA
ncbi:MAG: chitodextrinase, partial [Vicingaceae bacterium]